MIVEPSTVGLAIGETRQLTATARDASGGIIEGKPIAWSSSNTANATVVNGLVTAITGGPATITATADGISATATVTVGAAIATMSLAPASVTIPPGTTQQLTATLLDAAGVAITGRTVTWSSSSDATATVTPSGLVTAVANGSATITASSGGRSATAQITVAVNPATAPVETITILPAVPAPSVNAVTPLSVQARDVTGTLLTGRTFTWTTSDATIATVDTDGKLTGKREGSVIVTATTSGKSGTATLTIGAQVPVASIHLLPTSVLVAINATEPVVANFRDAAGHVLVNRAVTWTSSHTNLFTVGTDGRVRGVAAGNGTLTARAEGITGTAAVTVRSSTGTPARIDVTPANGTVEIGNQLPLTAKAYDLAGNQITSAVNYTWTSSHPNHVAVDQNGIVRGVQELNASTGFLAQIVASTPGSVAGGVVTDTVLVGTIPPRAVFKVVALPSQFRIGTNRPVQLSAQVYDNSNQLMTRTITWVSSNTAVATVTDAGVLTGVGVGTVQIKAISGGKEAAMDVTVQSPHPVVERIELRAQDGMKFAELVSKKIYVDLYDAQGNTLLNRYVQITSSNATVATVANDGTVSPRTAGTASLTATSEGKTVTASIRVYGNGEAYSVKLSPVSSTTLEASADSFAIQGTIKNYAGVSLGGQTMSWRTTSPGITLHSTSSTRDVAGWWVTTFQATAPGTIGIIGSSGTVADTAFYTVTAGAPVASLTITPNPFRVVRGLTARAEATVTDVNNRVVSRVVTWSTGNSSIATVNASGLVTGVGVGSTTLTATSEGKSATVTLDVSGESATAATIELFPTNFDLRITQRRTIMATVKNAQGTVLTGKTVSWTSSAPTIVYVASSSGTQAELHAERVGSATITATVDGVSASTTVRGVEGTATVAHVLVEPNPSTIAVNGTVQLTATARDASGNIVSSAPTWTSDNSGVATVTTAGLVRGVAAGTTRINATVGGVSGYMTVTVTAASGGGGTGGGGAGGGTSTTPPVGTLTGKTAGKCDFWWELPTPAPGAQGAWYAATLFLPLLEARVRTGTTNHAPAGAPPEYQYFVEFKNGYNQTIHFTLSGPRGTLPTSGALSKSLGAGETGASNNSYMNVPAKLYVYIEGIRFGSPWPGTSVCR